MLIRRYQPGEERELWELNYHTTHEINGRDYTPEQCNRWAPADADLAAWTARLARMQPFVAVHSGRIVGFAELEPDGHIDYFYCHHQRLNQGIGSALLRAIETEAAALGIASLYAESSVTAIDFFRAKGFHVEQERVNTVCGSPAKQYLVRKRI
jgi:putative acetyltransferase